jgi:hypothetical protein
MVRVGKLFKPYIGLTTAHMYVFQEVRLLGQQDAPRSSLSRRYASFVTILNDRHETLLTAT